MKKEREKCISGDELDSVTKIPLKVLDRPGVRKKIKKKMNKRSRRKIKLKLKKQKEL